MRKLVFTLSAALIVGGCSSGTDPVRDASLAQADAAATDASRAPASPVNTGRTTAFASMPDRGVLVAYDPSDVRKHDAYTLFPVQLSEAHALNAVAPGRTIRFQTPDGKIQTIAYARHEEGIDGNWSWVGKTADGLDAIITFGASAVFGRIDQRDAQPLRFTMRDGKAWLMQVNPGKLLDGDLLRDADDTDVLIPSAMASDIMARKSSATASKVPLTAAAPSTGANTVDVAVGFTNGMVTKYGTAQVAQTRISDLIARTNQAYINSQVEPRVRLVGTVQVNYTDLNDNEIALEALTGVSCTTTSCSPATVPAELVPLRTLRDTSGADLVSLIRPFRAPQQNGCGIAWLLGGGGFAIDNTDAPFGYSIVGDGDDTDETDGRTYFCREETLAHELGHNMGQQHNTEDSGGDSGTHAYSYGYRESSTTGFYTIMAYRLANSSQFSINYFGNPAVNYPSTTRPTGTATADNARSLNQSMLLVAQFRASIVPFANAVRNDFNGDGRSDIAMFNSSIGYFAYWIMNGSVYTGSGGFGVASGATPISTGRLGGTARSSLLARNTTTRDLFSYIWNGTTFAQARIGQYADPWIVIGQGDVNGDGQDDLFWRNTTTGQFAYWIMNGSVYVSAQTYSPPVTYVVAGFADFNGDGRTDLLWNDPGTRNASVWLSTGNGFDVRQIGQYGTDWNMVGTADVTGDGKADIILRDNARTYLAYWRMDGAVYQGASAFGLNSALDLFTTGDFNADGIEDLVISNPTTRTLYLWQSNGATFTQSTIGQYGADWTVLK